MHSKKNATKNILASITYRIDSKPFKTMRDNSISIFIKKSTLRMLEERMKHTTIIYMPEMMIYGLFKQKEYIATASNLYPTIVVKKVL